MELPKFINNGKYEEFDVTKFVEKGELSKLYEGMVEVVRYHQFIDTCRKRWSYCALFLS